MEEEPDEKAGKDKVTIESITEEEYMNVREYFEEELTKQVDEVLQRHIDQDMVASLIRSIDGIVAYYKREDNCTIDYGYAIGMRIDRNKYK